jgi:hypothetical protein
LKAAPVLVNHVGKLYLSEEAWEEKWKLRERSNGGGSSSRGGGGRGHGNGENDHDSSGSTSPGSGKVGRDQCRKCVKKGHWARDCRSKLKKEAAYAAQEEESLMLITATPRIEPQQTLAIGASKAVDMTTHIVHLCEEKVFAQLDEEEHNNKSWICDTGATNHMSGSRAAFTKLDKAMCGTVRFSDDSVAEIEGRGSVVFICKNGEHRLFARVYFIPRLMVNIVSVGQLDEAGYDIHIKNARMENLAVGCWQGCRGRRTCSMCSTPMSHRE